jgi:predicted DCC family thiol-disulfide oxidoreductase YuxK
VVFLEEAVELEGCYQLVPVQVEKGTAAWYWTDLLDNTSVVVVVVGCVGSDIVIEVLLALGGYE